MAFHILNTRLEWLEESQRPASGEALVIPANDHLWMLSGPGLELKRGHGKEFELAAVRLGPLEPGEVAVTAAEAAGFRWLFHAVVMGQDQKWAAGSGYRAARGVVERAAREKVSSLMAYPLYRGVHGKREEAAREMLSGYLEALQEPNTLRQVGILYHDAEEKSLLQETLVRLLGAPRG